jgi:hypothetical protein
MNDKHCSVDPPCPCLDDWLDLTSPLAAERLANALEAVDVRYAGLFSNERGPGPRTLAIAILSALKAKWGSVA